MHHLSARSQIPATAPPPIGGDVFTSGARMFLVVGVVKSDFDVCYNLELSTLK